MGEANLHESALGKFARSVASLRDVAAMEGIDTYMWKNDHTGTGALEIITDAQVYHNLEPGVNHFVTSVDLEVLTANKWCYFELGTTTANNGGGVFTAITPRWLLEKAATAAAGTFVFRPFTIPNHVGYSAGAVQCITYRIQTQDATTHVLMAWKGWER